MTDVPLFRAILTEDWPQIEAIIARDGPDVIIPGAGSALQAAVGCQKVAVVRWLLKRGACANGPASLAGLMFQDRPLHMAITSRVSEAVPLLIEHGADVHATDLQGSTPLQTAVALSDVEAAAALLAGGADPLVLNKHGVSPLSTAELMKKPKLAKLLRDAAAARSAQTLGLADAAKLGHTDRVKHLLAGNINAAELERALVAAIKAGHATCVDLLLTIQPPDKPVLPDVGQIPIPPVFVAVYEDQAECVSILARSGANLNATLRSHHANGVTPLMIAAQNGAHASAKALIAGGADPLLRDAGGHSALEYARLCARKRMIKLLEPLGAAQANQLTLHDAIRDGHLNRVRDLVEAGADVHAPDKAGHPPLLLAVIARSADMVKLLLSHGAGQTLDDKVRAALWTAALQRSFSTPVELVDALLAGALSVHDVLTPQGMRPIHLAAAFADKDTTVLRRLLAAGADPLATFMPIDSPELAKVRAMQAEVLGRAVPEPSPQSAIDLARTSGNRHALAVLLEHTGQAPDFYEQVLASLKRFKPPTDAFAQLAKELATDLKGSASPWKKRSGVFFISAYTPTLDALLPAARAKAQAAGASVVMCQLATGSGGRTGLIVLPTRNRAEILACCGTNAANYGKGTRELIPWFEQIHQRWPFDLTGCGFDFAELQFVMPIADHADLVRQLCEGCPDAEPHDVVDSNGRCFLWWD